MRLPAIPSAALGPVLLLSLLILLFFWHRPQPRPHIAPATAVTGLGSGWTELPPLELPDLPPLELPELDEASSPFEQRDDLNVFSTAGMYDEAERATLATELEQALDYGIQRFGSGPSEPITVSVRDDAACSLHGAAYTGQRRVEVVTCATLPRERAVSILAHEFIHQLAHDYYGPPHLQADMILLEGLASWGAGDYWLGGLPSFRAFVREHYEADQLLPLATSYSGRPMHEMNQLYYQWASFVEFLLDTYGRDRFDALYTTGARQPGSANYQAIYGKDLDTLEQEWRAWLEDGERRTS
jgi:hypothetical protein